MVGQWMKITAYNRVYYEQLRTYNGEQIYSILFHDTMNFIMPLRWSLGLKLIFDS